MLRPVTDLVICVATDLEAADLPPSGTIGRTRFTVLRTGVGPVNAAIALTRFLAEHKPAQILSMGVGGAYPGSGLEVGDVVSAASECYGDLGADSPDGFLDMEAIGFPVVGEYFNLLPVDIAPTANVVPFVTRSTCTGTRGDAARIVERTRGAVESMEGAAIVHTALVHRLPAGEVRGISNPIGDRDRSVWRLHEAAAAAAGAVRTWIEDHAC